MQAQTEAKALRDMVKEAKAAADQDDTAAMRQGLAEPQLTQADEQHSDARGGTETTTAGRQTDEIPSELRWGSQLQRDGVPADDEEQVTLAAKQSTADGISDLRAQLDRLSMAVPTLQRLQVGRVLSAS